MLPWDEDWFRRCGRLEEAGGSGEQLFTGRLGRMSRAQYSMPAYRSSRPQGPGGGTSFYLSHTVVRRVRRGPAPGIPRSGDAPAGRTYIYPDKAMSRAETGERQRRLDRQGGGRRLPTGMCGQVKAMGGVYDRARRCWHVPAEMVSKRVVPPGWRGRAAASSWQARRIGRPDSAPGTPARFQAYIERAEASESGRRAEIESDGTGEISFGTIGSTSEERIRFWEDAEARERPGGRVQHRIIAELPYWLSADDRRRIAERFCEVFTRLDLPHHGVVHLPDVDEGGDDRNVHLHVVYSDRPLARHPSDGSQPASGSALDAGASPRPDGSAAAKAGGGASGSRGRAPAKHPEAPGSPIRASLPPRSASISKRPEVAHVGWPGSLRRHFARVVNEVIAEAATRGIEPPAGRGFYDPRTYREMGVGKLPAQHMGAWRMRLERAGVPTLRGVRNGWKEGAWRVVEAAGLESLEARLVGDLAVRVDDAAAAHSGSRLVSALADGAADLLVTAPVGGRSDKVLEEVRRDFVIGRALRRAAWAAGQTKRVERVGGAGSGKPSSGGPARPGHGDEEGSSASKRLRLREIEAEALSTMEALSGAPPTAPMRLQGAVPGPREVDARVRTALRRLLGPQQRPGVGPAAVERAVVEGVDAVERGSLLERLKACRAAGVAAARRTGAGTSPKRALGGAERLDASDQAKVMDWRRRRAGLAEASAAAEARAFQAMQHLGRAIQEADAVMGRDRGPGLDRAWSAVGGDYERSPWRGGAADRPVLSWLAELRGRQSTGQERGETTASPAAALEGPHPFRLRTERRRRDGAAFSFDAADLAVTALRSAVGDAIAAVDAWIEAKGRGEAAVLSGPLVVVALPEEDEAWRRRRRQLEEEAGRMAAAALAWPLAGERAPPRAAGARGREDPLRVLERSWSRLRDEAAKAGRPAGRRGAAEPGVAF